MQWDAIEHDLRKPALWSFATGHGAREDLPTRIALLLDAVAGSGFGKPTARFQTFESLRQRVPTDVWNEVLDMHALLTGWFEDEPVFHRVGYLVAIGVSFNELVTAARGKRKSELRALLDGRIRQELDLSREELESLSYEKSSQGCLRVLLLMNVLATERANERYPFHRHAEEAWTLEHIHAQHSEGLSKAEQWGSWIDEHRRALERLADERSGPERAVCDALIDELQSSREHLDGQRFRELFAKVTRYFTAEGDDATSTHSLSNLALLAGTDNSALNNAVFEVKRQKLLELDRRGSFIPLCTRKVFMKYFEGATAHQVHFWGPADRASYLNAIEETLRPYLLEEVRHAQ